MPFVERWSMEVIALDVRKATTSRDRFEPLARKQRGAMAVLAMRLRDPKLGDLQGSPAGASEKSSVDLGGVPITEKDVERRLDLARVVEIEEREPATRST